MENEAMTTPQVPGDPSPPGEPPRRARRRIAGAGLVAAGLVSGAVLASSLGASADTTSPTPSTSASSGSGAGTGTARPGPGGSAPVRSDEQEVTGTKAATLKAAALKAVPGGTVIRVETDAGDAAYEVHMKKADGTLVTVKFDQNLKVTATEAGMGQGDPAPKGNPPAGAGAAPSA